MLPMGRAHPEADRHPEEPHPWPPRPSSCAATSSTRCCWPRCWTPSSRPGSTYELADVEIGRTNTDPSTARDRARGRPGRARPAHRRAPGARRQPGRAPARPRWWPPTSTACCRSASTPPPTWPPTCCVDGAVAAGREPGDGLRHRRSPTARARTIPMHRVRVGDQIVVGSGGVRVHAPAKQRGASAFEFMSSEVSSEKPKALVVQQVADRIRAAHDGGRQGARRVRPGGRAHRRRARRRPPGRRRAGSTCCSPATASPPTTSSRTCSARRSACLLAEGTLTEGGH